MRTDPSVRATRPTLDYVETVRAPQTAEVVRSREEALAREVAELRQQLMDLTGQVAELAATVRRQREEERVREALSRVRPHSQPYSATTPSRDTVRPARAR